MTNEYFTDNRDEVDGEVVDKNIHVGKFLYYEFIEPCGLSGNAVARAINVHPSRIHEIIKGERAVTIDTDLRLCKLFRQSDGFFLRVQEHCDMLRIKGSIQAELDAIQPLFSETLDEEENNISSN